MLSAKHVGLLSGVGMMIAAASWLGGCGTGNNYVPQAPVGGVAGGYGICSYGQTTYPINNGYGNYTCYAGYVFNGSTCVCNSGYGYGYGYGNGYGYGTQVMCNNTWVYTTNGLCPPGTVPGH